MNVQPKTVKGNIFIAHQAIASLVHKTVLETYGVVGLAPKNFAHDITRAITGDGNRGIAIKHEKGQLIIDVYIVIEYGTRIKTVASVVADTISYRIPKITGIPVSKINVHVRGLRISNTD